MRAWNPSRSLCRRQSFGVVSTVRIFKAAGNRYNIQVEGSVPNMEKLSNDITTKGETSKNKAKERKYKTENKRKQLFQGVESGHQSHTVLRHHIG